MKKNSADLQIYADIILCQNFTKTAHLAKKRILGEVLNDFYLIIVPYHTTKFQKKILRADPEWVKIVNLA